MIKLNDSNTSDGALGYAPKLEENKRRNWISSPLGKGN